MYLTRVLPSISEDRIEMTDRLFRRFSCMAFSVGGGGADDVVAASVHLSRERKKRALKGGGVVSRAQHLNTRKQLGLSIIVEILLLYTTNDWELC